jgi:hypothetical protein
MFCRKKASSTEDVWPLWLMRRFPSSDKARTYAEIGARDLGNWRSAKPTLAVKRVCGACNNGWMSRLEEQAKPVLESILDDKLKAVDTLLQAVVARWAVKTVMVLEAVDSSRSCFYSEDERSLMRTTQSIPKRTSVWIAMCVDHRDIYSAAKDLRTSRGDDGIRAFATTMAFGPLAVQVVSIKTPAEIASTVAVTYEVSDGPWDRTLVQVWPSSANPLVWPPEYGLAQELGLEALTERLRPDKKYEEIISTAGKEG